MLRKTIIVLILASAIAMLNNCTLADSVQDETCSSYFSPNLAPANTIKYTSSCYSYGQFIDLYKNKTDKKNEDGRQQRAMFRIDQSVNVYQDIKDATKDRIIVLYQKYTVQPVDTRVNQTMLVNDINEHVGFFQVKFEMNNTWTGDTTGLLEMYTTPNQYVDGSYTTDNQFLYGFLQSQKAAFGNLNSLDSNYISSNLTLWEVHPVVNSPDTALVMNQAFPFNSRYHVPENQRKWYRHKAIKPHFHNWLFTDHMIGAALPYQSTNDLSGAFLTVYSAPAALGELNLQTTVTHTMADAVFGSFFVSHNPYSTWDYGAVQKTSINANAITPSVDYFINKRVSKFNPEK